VHEAGNRDCRDRLNRKAGDCCVLHSAEMGVVRRRAVGREHGAAAAEAMRRRRIALDGAIFAV
jgi:hypothetical protein